MPVRLTYHGSPNASSILQEGFRPGRMLSVAPGQVFSTPNVNFASGYGNPVKMATSTNAFSLPSVNLSSGQIGKEVIQSPQNATRGMQLAQMAERLKNVSPTAARLLGGETIRGIGASSIGRSALVRTVGTLLGGTVAGTAGILTSPYIAIANHLYGPNAQKAHDFVGMSGEAMPFSGDADMYPEYFSNLGKQGTSQALSDTVLAEPPTGIMNIETPKGFDYNFDKNVLKEEEDAQYNLDNKRSFNMEGILQNLGGYAKDAAGRYIGLEALGGAGTMIGGPVVGGIAALAGLVGGGNLFNSPYIGAGAYTMDQYGNMYTADQLNKMNARGGYYSEPARDSRRRDQSIRRMEERKAQGLGYGINRLEQLKQQAAQEEAARQSALDAYFGGSDAGADSGRFDGASSRSEYDSNPTGYSGSS
jgi:hypothetical protein